MGKPVSSIGMGKMRRETTIPSILASGGTEGGKKKMRRGRGKSSRSFAADKSRREKFKGTSTKGRTNFQRRANNVGAPPSMPVQNKSGK